MCGSRLIVFDCLGPLRFSWQSGLPVPSPAELALSKISAVTLHGINMDGIKTETMCPKDPNRSWKLLILGILFAWLVLVHLLVNVWLLLLFSAFMAAIGAWLGPQVILGSGTTIHLERFINLEQSSHSPDAEGQLDKEIGLTIQKIMQDFVSSWYRRLSHETAFEDELRGVMWDLAMELKKRVSSADREELTRKLLILGGCHLQCYKWAKARVAGIQDDVERESRLWDAYQELSPVHRALSSSSVEVNHARWLVELLLKELVPKPHLESRTGRHLVVELIACNVVLPLVGRMSEPDWINMMLTNIFSKGHLKMEEEKNESPVQLTVPKSLPLGINQEQTPQLVLPSPLTSNLSNCDGIETSDVDQTSERGSRDTLDGIEEMGQCKNKLDVFSVQYLQPPTTTSPFFLCEESELESPMSDLGREMDPPLMNSSDDLLSDCCLDSLTPAESPIVAPNEDSGGCMLEDGGLLVQSGPPSRPEILIEPTELSSEFTGTPPTEKEGFSPLDASPLITSSPTAPLHPFSFVPITSPDGPVLIQNLRITGTITAREHSGTGSHPYTLYTIKYDTALDSQSLGTLQPMAYHTVNRRYREFLNLQTRLEEKAELRKFVKHIKGPKKLFPDLPFGNMDSEKVEARKSLLESFLKQLCAVPEIASSEEVQEFLALNTDARIAFVKKPFMVSRIDKFVVNAIVDTLKTAFPRSEPQSPTDELSENEVDGKSQNDGKKSAKSRLRFPSSKIAPVLSSAETQEKIIYSVREGSTVSEALSAAGMESFIQKQDKILRESAGYERMPTPKSSETPTNQLRRTGLDGGLSAVALEVLWLAMREQWSWLCTDNMQKLTHLLCGSLIQRWLEVQVNHLTSMQRWALYLRLLQQAIWPGGALRTQPRPIRTQEQKDAACAQALQSLMGILPDLAQEILGAQKCRQAWQSALDSLQHPQINSTVTGAAMSCEDRDVSEEDPELASREPPGQALQKEESCFLEKFWWDKEQPGAPGDLQEPGVTPLISDTVTGDAMGCEDQDVSEEDPELASREPPGLPAGGEQLPGGGLVGKRAAWSPLGPAGASTVAWELVIVTEEKTVVELENGENETTGHPPEEGHGALHHLFYRYLHHWVQVQLAEEAGSRINGKEGVSLYCALEALKFTGFASRYRALEILRKLEDPCEAANGLRAKSHR
ncbi:sorting nexin-19 [Discoglossus pictus]